MDEPIAAKAGFGGGSGFGTEVDMIAWWVGGCGLELFWWTSCRWCGKQFFLVRAWRVRLKIRVRVYAFRSPPIVFQFLGLIPSLPVSLDFPSSLISNPPPYTPMP